MRKARHEFVGLPIQHWLNRLLAFPIALQNAVFDEYLALVEARIDALRQAGKLDVGVETIVAERIVEVERHLLRVDRETHVETHLLRLELHRRANVVTFEQLIERWHEDRDVIWLRNGRSGMVAAQVWAPSRLADDGSVIRFTQLVRPTKTERMRRSALAESHWEPIALTELETLWRAETATAIERVDIETVNLAAGLLLSLGLFTEIIAYKTRLFCPVDRVKETIRRLSTPSEPLTDAA